MKLQKADKNRSAVQLENDHEAHLFASDGLGLSSIKGIRLALDVMKVQAANEWPVEVTARRGRLEHAANRMSDEAARLSVFATLAGFGEYPDAAENEITLLDMSSTIRKHLESSVPETI